MQRRLPVAAALALSLAAAPALATTQAQPRREAYGVIAVVDSGINPYHTAFRDSSPRAYRHPSTYLPGFPRNAVALNLTFGAPDYWTALRRDCARVWSKVRPGTLYWVPGTRVVGAISFDLTKPGIDCGLDQPVGAPVLDEHGHGTMTASRAVGAPWGACRECLVVSVQFQAAFGINNTKAAALSTERSVGWAAANASWIDAQSNSWGVLPVPDMTGEGGLFFDHPSLTRAVEDAARKHLSFWSTGNGIANFGGVVGMPTVGGHHTPSAIRVGAHDSGRVTTWSGQTPHLVGDGCDSWAALNRTLDGWDERHGGGTSAAAPYVAANAVRMLVAARAATGDKQSGVRGGAVVRARQAPGTGPLADRVLTLDEWRGVLLASATPRPEPQKADGPPCPDTDPLFHPTPVSWRDVPAGAPGYLLLGYGAVDEPAYARGRDALLGRAPVPARAAEDAFFAVDRAAREAAHPVHRGA